MLWWLLVYLTLSQCLITLILVQISFDTLLNYANFHLKDAGKNSHHIGPATPAPVPSLVLDPSLYHLNAFKGRVLCTSVLRSFQVQRTRYSKLYFPTIMSQGSSQQSWSSPPLAADPPIPKSDIHRWAPFAVASNTRWSRVRFRMNSIISVGNDLILPVMHRHTSRCTLQMSPSCRTTPLSGTWWWESLSRWTSNEDYSVGSPIFFLLLSYKPLGLMCLSEQCDRPVGCTGGSYQAWFLGVSLQFSSQSSLRSSWEFSDSEVWCSV